MAVDGWTQVQPSASGWSVYKPPRRPRRNVKPKLVRPTRPVRRPYVDPLAPLSEKDLRSRAGAMTNEAIAPLLAQLQAAIESRSKSGQAAIAGYTSQLGHFLEGAAPQTAAAYNAAIGQQSQVNSELANRLGAFGQGLAGEQSSKLALQGAPAGVIPDAAQTATGAANANFAVGAADISRLVSDSAAAQAYGAKLPGIAALGGLQSSKELEFSLSKEFADKSGELTAKGQSMLVDLYDKLEEREFQKALARQSGQFSSEKALADARYKAQQIAYKKADLAYRRAKSKADRARQAAADQERARAARARERQQRTNAAERAREARAREAQQRANARERRRHNKKTEKNKGKSSGDGLP